MKKQGAAFAGFVLLAAIQSPAEIATIHALKDNTLYEDVAGAVSNGAGVHLFSGRTGAPAQQKLRRALIAFDVANNIPSGSTINSVTLQLRLTNPISGGQGNQTVSIRRVNADWGQGGSDAGDPGGAGTTSTTGDATWIHRFFNTQPWTTAGGDFSATVSASQIVNTNATYAWGSTPQMVADVQDWLDNPATAFGWIVIANEITPSTALRFASSETFEITPPNDFRPVLTVDYTPLQLPAMSASGISLLAIGLLVAGGLVASRRRTAPAVIAVRVRR